MNLKVKILPTITKLIIVVACFLLILLGSFLTKSLWQEKRKQEKVLQGNSKDLKYRDQLIRKETYRELSPDGYKKITRYELSNNSELFSNSYTTYLDNNVIISVTNNLGGVEREYYIFIGEQRAGKPYWLGNNYIFFTSYCGSSCQGLTLLDVRTGKKWLAVLSSLSEEGSQPKTHFHDWFERDFEFSGFVLDVNGVMKNNEPYLLFNLKNKEGVETGQKRFLFTGNSLILKN